MLGFRILWDRKGWAFKDQVTTFAFYPFSGGFLVLRTKAVRPPFCVRFEVRPIASANCKCSFVSPVRGARSDYVSGYIRGLIKNRPLLLLFMFSPVEL